LAALPCAYAEDGIMKKAYRMMMEFTVSAASPSEAREKAGKLVDILNAKNPKTKAKVWRAKEISDRHGWKDGIKKKGQKNAKNNT